MAEVMYTADQRLAITHEGGSLLVSAAAGSGKTKVLVERLLRKIEMPEREVDIDDFLIITYTRAAASELRGKILEEISQRLAQNPTSRHLRRQLSLCYKAQISTIHSFCSEIIRENAQMLDMSPDFRVADDGECDVIKADVLDTVLNSRYEEQGTAAFYELVDVLGAGIDDSRLAATVLDAYAKLQSHPFPAAWVSSMLEALNLPDGTDAGETPWGRLLLDSALEKLTHCEAELRSILDEMEALPDFKKAYFDSVFISYEGVRTLIGAISNGWDAAVHAAKVEFPRPKSISGYDELKEKRKACKKMLDGIADTFRFGSAELLEDIAAVRPVIQELYRLVLDFDSAYAAEKSRRGIIDFSDQEHMAARLLYDEGSGTRTALARAVSERYEEIMVDEYQDVNAVQELIFSSIARDGGNVFMVGDVKQSIYRFRLADPTIFLQKYREYKDAADAAPGEGARVLLSANFRSKRGVLDAVNFVFKNIMSTEFGEMDYTPREYLHAGRGDCESDTPAVSLTVIDMAAIEHGEDEESVKKQAVEAEYIAAEIGRILAAGTTIPDGRGGERPVQYSDFTILLPAMKGKSGIYASALQSHGIPAGLPGSDSFFGTIEISIVMSLLEIVDNPLQDIPLVAVLRSPVYGFTPDELARIKSYGRDTFFYTSLVSAACDDERCAAFLRDLDSLRLLAPDITADAMIWHIYSKTKLPALVGAMQGGRARRRNLVKLAALAKQFESNGYRGLFAFVTHMRRLEKQGREPADDSDDGDSGAVRIMSIHKSKGLEFPFVFLADTSKRFNMQDFTKPVLAHSELGVGIKRRDTGRRIEYTTLLREAVKLKLKQELLAEQLRVLYVAMTRARERLYLVATLANAQKELEKLSKSAASPVSPAVLNGAGSFSDYILLTALTRPEAEQIGFYVPTADTDKGEPWDIKIVDARQPTATGGVRSSEERAAPVPELMDDMQRGLRFEYPHMSAASVPSKLTATSLKGRHEDAEAAEDAAPSDAREKPLFNRPEFIISGRALTAAEKGTALHLVMQYIDFSRCGSIPEIEAEIARLTEQRFVTRQQADAVNPQKLLTLFKSDTGARILGAESVRREFKFSVLLPAKEYYPEAGDDEILLQGVIDCYYEEKGELTVVDFKTDYVTPETVHARAQEYLPQVDAYSRALERITGMPVAGKILYFFALDTAIEI